MGLATMLTACAPEKNQDGNDLLSFRQRVLQENTNDDVKKPRIPNADDLKASVLDVGVRKEDETKALLQEIEKRVAQPTIVYDDIQRGWYTGGVEEKKIGTPSTWVWVKEGSKSRWISPNALEKTVTVATEELCKSTAGTYVISCVQSEAKDCEYIPANTCRCIDGSMWNEEQGCLLINDKKEFVSISPDELRRGWYGALPNQKKINTPSNWVWVEAGANSRWQNPNPLN